MLKMFHAGPLAMLALAGLGVTVPSAAAATEFGPQGVVRQFCRADGMGYRLRSAQWPRVAPLVEWRLEPAWDHLSLISSYEIGGTRSAEGGAIAVDVRYIVVGTLSAQEFDANTRAETHTFLVHAPDERGWRIIGPPPAPHVFSNRASTAELRRLLQHGTAAFLANTLFVWQMLGSAGWEVPYQSTLDLLDGSVFAPVDNPQPGDLVVYLRNGVAYHAGLLEAEGVLVSSTANAGLVRARVEGFPGEVRYLRLVAQSPSAEEPRPAQPRR
jgi:hypothetical protein